MVFRKMNIFGGMKKLLIFFGGHHKAGLFLGVISIHFRAFLNYRMGFFMGLPKFQICFGGMPDIPDIFFCKQ